MTGWIVSSSVLIAAVALLRRVLKGRISPWLQYALWGLVLVRLLVPFRFGSTNLSVDNITERVSEQPEVKLVSILSQMPLPRMTYGAAYEQVAEEYAQKGVDIGEMTLQEFEHVDYEIVDRMLGELSALDVLRRVWLAGSAVLGVVLLTCNLRFALRLKRSRHRLEDMSTLLPVYVSGVVETPCLFGLLKPAVYLTPEAAEDETVQRHAVFHEATHFRHGDHIWSLLRCVCLVVHWYNPLVWLAAGLSRQDGELACDAGTLRLLGEEERVAYGNTLIDLAGGKRSKTSLFYTATTMSGGKEQLKERVTLIAKKPKMLAVTAAAVVLVAAVAVGCTFTGAPEDNTEPPVSDDLPVTTDSPAPVTALSGQTPQGVVRLCEAVGENQYLLLCNNPEDKYPQSKSGTFYLYDAEDQSYQSLVSGDNLWDGLDYHVAVTDSEILYETSGGRLFVLKQADGQWALTERTIDGDAPYYVISPDGTKRAVRLDGTVRIFNMTDDTLLAETDDFPWVHAMKWSEDSSRLAMVSTRPMGAAVWDVETDDMFFYDAGQDPNAPASWSDILRAYLVGDNRYLVVDYLCETGMALLIWDVEQDAFSDKLQISDDLTILDISGDAILYDIKPQYAGAHTLDLYHCASKKSEVLDRYEGFYTAGCLNTPNGQPLVFRYGDAAPAESLSPDAGQEDRPMEPILEGFAVEIDPETVETCADVGRQWAAAFAAQYLNLSAGSSLYSSEVASTTELWSESVVEPKRLVVNVRCTCRAVYPDQFLDWFAGWAEPVDDPDFRDLIQFGWLVELEDAGGNQWRCASAGSGGFGGWGYLNYHEADTFPLIVKDAIDRDDFDGSAENIMRGLPVFDPAEFNAEFGAEGWEKVLAMMDAYCLTEGRVYSPEAGLMWSHVYPRDQEYRDMYVILTALSWKGTYAKDLVPILKKQRDYDAKAFDRCFDSLTPEQAETIQRLIQQ